MENKKLIYNTQSHQFKSFLDQKTLAALKIQHHWKLHSLEGKKNKFFEACTNGNLGTIKHIVESGFDINIRNDKGETPLIYAASLPDDTSQIEKIVEYLISKGWDLNAVCSEGCNALETAVAFDSEVACRTLLNYKDRFDINHQSNDGTTALIESV